MSIYHEWKKKKGVKLFAMFVLSKLREYEEVELQKRFLLGDYDYNEILIRESSKPIYKHKLTFDLVANKKQSEILLFSCNNSNERNVNLIYLTLLKFNGLIKYMNFQDLLNDDIRKISCFIKHKYMSKGQYLFRQYDRSDAMYGVITGKVGIRLVSPIDYTKKFHSSITKGDFDNEDSLQNIPEEYFMSDLEEENEDSDDDEYKVEIEEEDSIDEKNHILKDHISKRLEIKDKDTNENRNEIINKMKKEDEQILKTISEISKEINLTSPNTEKSSHKKGHRGRLSTEDYLDSIIDFAITVEEKKKSRRSINNEILQLLKNKNRNKIKNKLKDSNLKLNIKKEYKIIKAIQKHQTPDNILSNEELSKFILDFEIERAQLSEGMCFGEWGILYNIPRTTSIYCNTDTNLFYLNKKYFDRILSKKFTESDMKKIKFILARIPALKKDYKMGKMLTKILPLFCERGDIIYTPFDKAEIIYIVYKGECAFYKPIGNIKEKENIHIEKMQMISRLDPGGMGGLESCIKGMKYKFFLVVTSPMTIIYKVEVNFMLQMYKTFREDILPLYHEQKNLFDNLIRNFEETTKNNSLKNVILKEKQKKLNEELHKEILRPASSTFKSYQISVNLKNIKNKLNQKRPLHKKSLMTLDYSSNLPIIIHPSNYKTISNESIKEYNNFDNFFITSNSKQSSSFNLRTKQLRSSIKTKIFSNEVNLESQNDENNKNSKILEIENQYNKRLKQISNNNLISRNKKNKSIENSIVKEISSFYSNYSDKSGVKYFKSGKYDLPFLVFN